MKYTPHLKVCICMFILTMTNSWIEKNVYYGGKKIFIWNDTFQVDNESECFLEREW